MSLWELVERGFQEFLSTGNIRNNKVVNFVGEDLGKNEELMVTLQKAEQHTILSFGGFLGMADKLFATPWKSLKLRPHEHSFTLDIFKEILEKAEGFDKDRLPLTPEELSRSYRFYGNQPYWQT
jgi:hypothetical protein